MIKNQVSIDTKLKHALLNTNSFNIHFNKKFGLKSEINNDYAFPDAPLKETGPDITVNDPIDYSTMTPGWLEPQDSQSFITDMIDEPVLLHQSTVITMGSLMQDISYLDVDFKWESQRGKSSAQSVYDADGNEYKIVADPKGKSIKLEQIKRTDPDMSRKQLLARPIHARSWLTDNFLEENIMRQNFLPFWKNFLAQKSGPAFEALHLFAKMSGEETVERGSASLLVRGLLGQFDRVSNDSGKLVPENEPQGFSRVVFGDNIVNGLFDVILEYGDQEGDSLKNTLLLPPQIISRLKAEIAADRETDFGDKIYVDGDVPKILGTEIKQDNVLRKSENGWNNIKYYTQKDSTTDGRKYKKVPTGVSPTAEKTAELNDVVYGILGRPSNIVFGMFQEFNMFHARNHMGWGWDIGMRAKADTTFLKEKDTLIIPFTLQKESAS